MRLPQTITGRVLACALGLALLFAGHAAAGNDDRFFPETNQHLDNQYGFLAFWDAHDGAELLGSPVTGVLLEANVPVQYFERGRLENRQASVAMGALGRERTRWRSFPAMRPHESGAGEQIFAETGHSVAGSFLRFWREHDGADLFGPPLSEPHWEVVDGSSVLVQYFERARLEQLPGGNDSAVVVGQLGRELAIARGLLLPQQQAAVSVIDPLVAGQAGAPFAELAPPMPTPIPPTATPIPPTDTPAPIRPTPTTNPSRTRSNMATPTPTPPSKPPSGDTSAGKLIDVNLSTQWLVVMEDGQTIKRMPVATGKDGFNTPTGTYSIYSKLRLRTMRGSLNGQTWVVPNVPNVMYINGGVALHGTYWHNKFGTGVRMSHGCVNLSLADAAWMYDWAPVGTRVVIHY